MSLTQSQQEAVDLRSQGLSQSAIAEKLGISRASVRHRLDAATKKDQAVVEAMSAAHTEMTPNLLWVKTKGEGTTYSLQLKPKQEQEEISFLDQVHEVFQEIPKAPLITKPRVVLDELMSVYPLFDVHLGLRARAEASGEDVNLRSAQDRLLNGFSQLLATTPASKLALVVNGGDFTHADDDENATPSSKHVLDVDSRNFETVHAAVEVIAQSIEMLLMKHEKVEYISVPGNHDPKNWITISVALYYRFKDHDRVTINLSQIEFSVFVFGKTLITVHHGHKRKENDLVMFFAAEYAQLWGESKHRYLFTGHFHSREAKRYPGIYWERMEPICPRDHYAASTGYDQAASMLSITFHKEKGEQFRTRVAL